MKGCKKSQFLTVHKDVTDTLYVGKHDRCDFKECASTLYAEKGTLANPVSSLQEAFHLIEQRARRATVISLFAGDYDDGSSLTVPSQVRTIVSSNGPSAIPALTASSSLHLEGLRIPSVTFHAHSSSTKTRQNQQNEDELVAYTVTTSSIGNYTVSATGSAKLQASFVNGQVNQINLSASDISSSLYTFEQVIASGIITPPYIGATFLTLLVQNGSTLGLSIANSIVNRPQGTFINTIVSDDATFHYHQSSLEKHSTGSLYRFSGRSQSIMTSQNNLNYTYAKQGQPIYDFHATDQATIHYQDGNSTFHVFSAPVDDYLAHNEDNESVALVRAVLEGESRCESIKSNITTINSTTRRLYATTLRDNARQESNYANNIIQTKGPFGIQQLYDNASQKSVSTNQQITYTGQEPLDKHFIENGATGKTVQDKHSSNNLITASTLQEVPLYRSHQSGQSVVTHLSNFDSVSNQGQGNLGLCTFSEESRHVKKVSANLWTGQQTIVSNDSASTDWTLSNSVCGPMECTSDSDDARNSVTMVGCQGSTMDVVGPCQYFISGSKLVSTTDHVVILKDRANMRINTSSIVHDRQDIPVISSRSSTCVATLQMENAALDFTTSSVTSSQSIVDDTLSPAYIIEMKDSSSLVASACSFRNDVDFVPCIYMFDEKSPGSNHSASFANCTFSSKTNDLLMKGSGTILTGSNTTLTGVLALLIWLLSMKQTERYVAPKDSKTLTTTCETEEQCKAHCGKEPTVDDIPMIANYCDSGCNKPKDEAEPQFYMCPHLMLGSDDLLEAAKKDGNEWAYYGVATHFNDKGGCGHCYQISYLPYCGKYWAENDDHKEGPVCCASQNPDGTSKCSYSGPYDCFQSQLSHCCLEGTCDNCQEWSGPTSTKLKDENPSQDACTQHGGVYCPGWCEVCKGSGGDCERCRFFPTTPLIVQSFNNGIDCTPPRDDSSGQFDIYMGAGGLGANVGCASPSSDGTYGGGFYGGALDDWPDEREGHRNGGVSRFDMCDEIAKVPGFRLDDNDWNGQKNWGKEMIRSCKFVMGNSPSHPVDPYHGNWAIRYTEVECPKELTKVTGLRLKDPTKGYAGQVLPKPSPDLVKSTGREGTLKDGFPGYTSSMMDCCKPSCSVNDMVKAIRENGNDIDPTLPSIFMCDKDGKKMYQNKEGLNHVYLLQDGKKAVCYDSKDLSICQGKMTDYASHCDQDEDCCSGICSIGPYNSMCCPLFEKADGNGNCVYVSDT